MLELLTLTLAVIPSPEVPHRSWGHRERPQREEGIPKKFQPLAGEELMPSHSLLTPAVLLNPITGKKWAKETLSSTSLPLVVNGPSPFPVV